MCSIVATYSTPFLSTAVLRTSNSSRSCGYLVPSAKKLSGGMPNSWFSMVMLRLGSDSLAASDGLSSNRRDQTLEVFPASVKASGAGMDCASCGVIFWVFFFFFLKWESRWREEHGACVRERERETEMKGKERRGKKKTKEKEKTK